MLGLSRHDGPKPKCFFTRSILPTFVDHSQIPGKKQPFSTISGQTFTHTLCLVLPRASVQAFTRSLQDGDNIPHSYAKVYMKLEDIISGDFFDNYIKTGNILMLSHGRPGIDPIFSLIEGILRMEVDKPTFERMGLQGTPIPSQGPIELNLRLPSMVRGKKGFERILWAFRNVTNHSLAWLFYDLRGPTDGSGAISVHQPGIKTVEPIIEQLNGVMVPQLPENTTQTDDEVSTDLLEWLSLVAMSSPRITKEDDMDPYLSRYQVPHSAAGGEDSEVIDLSILTWHGFLPSRFIQQVYLSALKAAGESWYSLTEAAFDGKSYTILQKKQSTMIWEYVD